MPEATEQRAGVITEVEYRGDGTRQWTTIDRQRYSTDWKFEDVNWKFGDEVTFEAYRDDPRMPWRARNIKRKEKA
jgi:hypothetical protein